MRACGPHWRELAAQHGYATELSWWEGAADGRYDVVLWRPDLATRARAIAFWDAERLEPLAWETYANDPLQGKLRQHLLPQVRDALEEKLPEYMLPSAYVLLDEMPLTANGKVDRRALPAPVARYRHVATAYEKPRTELEVALARIWSEVLGMAEIGMHDNFFEIGGHSLLATQVMSRLRSQMGIEVPLSRLFEQPTIAGLAASAQSGQTGSTATEDAWIVAIKHKGEAVLSYAQQRLWFLDQLTPGNPFYISPLTLRLKGGLDRVALHRSLNAIIARHESLRTTLA